MIVPIRMNSEDFYSYLLIMSGTKLFSIFTSRNLLVNYGRNATITIPSRRSIYPVGENTGKGPRRIKRMNYQHWSSQLNFSTSNTMLKHTLLC